MQVPARGAAALAVIEVGGVQGDITKKRDIACIGHDRVADKLLLLMSVSTTPAMHPARTDASSHCMFVEVVTDITGVLQSRQGALGNTLTC